MRSKYVAQTFVYGDSLKSTLVAVVVPEESVVAEWAKQQGVAAGMGALAGNGELKALILKDIHEQGKLGGLKGFEQVSSFWFGHWWIRQHEVAVNNSCLFIICS